MQVFVGGLLIAAFALGAGSGSGGGMAAAPETMGILLEHERAATEHRDHFFYVAKERSDRTGGHEWTERVAETTVGKIHRLIAEDGVPLNPEREGQERGRLAALVADPSGFAKREQAQKSDEEHAKELLALLPKAFLFESPRMEGPWERIDFRPNPEYQPRNMEERVLHGMTGSVLLDPKTVRLHRLEGVLPADVSIGMGLLATIRAGSRFATERAAVETGEWKTTLIDTDINGRAVFFKTVARKQHQEHSDFRMLPADMTVAQAVEMLER